MTDNKAATQFFQAKQIPPKLWNFCDQVLHFNFILAHVPGIENPAADYLSRLDVAPANRVSLRLTDSIPIDRIELNMASKTPKQDDEQDIFNPDEMTSADNSQPTNVPKEQIDVILTMLTERDCNTNDDYRC